jgi:hypothetical protein
MQKRWTYFGASRDISWNVFSSSRRAMSGPLGRSIQTTLLNDNIFAHDEAMRRHLTQFWQHAAYVLIGINEGDDHREITASFNEVGCMYFISAKESGYGMKNHCSSDILCTQILENFQVQGAMVP